MVELIKRILARRSRISTQLYLAIGGAVAMTIAASLVGWFFLQPSWRGSKPGQRGKCARTGGRFRSGPVGRHARGSCAQASLRLLLPGSLRSLPLTLTMPSCLSRSRSRSSKQAKAREKSA